MLSPPPPIGLSEGGVENCRKSFLYSAIFNIVENFRKGDQGEKLKIAEKTFSVIFNLIEDCGNEFFRFPLLRFAKDLNLS